MLIISPKGLVYYAVLLWQKSVNSQVYDTDKGLKRPQFCERALPKGHDSQTKTLHQTWKERGREMGEDQNSQIPMYYPPSKPFFLVITFPSSQG